MENLTAFLGLLLIWSLLYGFYRLSLKSYEESE